MAAVAAAVVAQRGRVKLKLEDAEKIVRILQHRIPNYTTTIELFDGEQLEIGDFEINFNIGENFGHLTWTSSTSFELIDVTDICKIIDTETGKVIVSVDLDDFDPIEVKPPNEH